MSESEKSLVQFWITVMIVMIIGLVVAMQLSHRKSQNLRLEAIEFKIRKLEERK